MKTDYFQMLKLSGAVLVGAILGFTVSPSIEVITGEGKVNLTGLKHYQINAAPCFMADVSKTEHDGFLVTFVAADGSRIGMIFDQKEVINIYRGISDQNNEYMIFDKNADGLPEFRKTRNIGTGISTTERLKIMTSE